MFQISDHTLLQGLQKGHIASADLIYHKCFPSISTYVLKKSGNTADAEDLFQETLIVLLGNLKKEEFLLSSSLKTYLFSIAQNLWLKKLRQTKNIALAELTADVADITSELDLVETQEYKVSTWLGRITVHCKNLLQAIYFFEESKETLMQRMGWKNQHTANNQKYKCLQQIIREKDKDLSGGWEF